MKLRYQQGGVVEVGEARAERLLATGLFRKIETPARASESSSEPYNPDPKGIDTPEVQEQAERRAEKPSATEVRSWARENTDIKVPAKGRVPDAAFVAYIEAHQNDS